MRVTRLMVLGAALLGAGATRLEAQATTYEACYVPSVGAIYLINLPGLPAACLAQSHVAFSWTEGGTVADGSVTLAKLAFDPATQAELDALAAALAAIGTINASTNPVDWSQLKNVPAGFADGVDDGGGTSSDLVCTGCVGATDLANDAVTTAKIANTAVTAAKLDFDPATQPELDALTGGLAAAGTINTPTNPVDWTQLKNVPAGFADGTDDGGAASDHGGLTGLGDDDHTQYLLTNGLRNATDGFAVGGTLSTGAIPATGAGVRLMWYPAKAAFRAGAVTSIQWNDANVGGHSSAMGSNTTASGFASTALGSGSVAGGNFATATGSGTTATGLASTAMGENTDAMGTWSTAMGNTTTASGASSTAMGAGTTASGVASTAMGATTLASGRWSIAMGNSTTANADYSTAMGLGTTASGDWSLATGVGTEAIGYASSAIGSSTNATGDESTAMGALSTASGRASTAMGDGAHASGQISTAMGLSTAATGSLTVAMGLNTTAQAFLSVVMGRYNVIAGSQTSWLTTDPLFVAGNGSSAASPSNALTLFKNGNLTIAGTLTQSSDIRLKEGITPLTSVLEGVSRLRPVRYRFREGTGHPTEPQIGLIAQAVEQIFPELVARDAQGYLSVAYTDLAVVLVRAMQEQQSQIAALKAEVAALRAAADPGGRAQRVAPKR